MIIITQRAVCYVERKSSCSGLHVFIMDLAKISESQISSEVMCIEQKQKIGAAFYRRHSGAESSGLCLPHRALQIRNPARKQV